jgi:hypothetical protein
MQYNVTCVPYPRAVSDAGISIIDHQPILGSPEGCSSHHNSIPGSGRKWVVTSQSASKLQPSVDMEDVADAYDAPSARDTVDPQATLCARVFLERDMITPLKEGLE